MPFAGYQDFDDCVARNRDKGDPDAYCGSIKHKVEDSLTLATAVAAATVEVSQYNKAADPTAHSVIKHQDRDGSTKHHGGMQSGQKGAAYDYEAEEKPYDYSEDECPSCGKRVPEGVMHKHSEVELHNTPKSPHCEHDPDADCEGHFHGDEVEEYRQQVLAEFEEEKPALLEWLRKGAPNDKGVLSFSGGEGIEDIRLWGSVQDPEAFNSESDVDLLIIMDQETDDETVEELQGFLLGKIAMGSAGILDVQVVRPAREERKATEVKMRKTLEDAGLEVTPTDKSSAFTVSLPGEGSSTELSLAVALSSASVATALVKHGKVELHGDHDQSSHGDSGREGEPWEGQREMTGEEVNEAKKLLDSMSARSPHWMEAEAVDIAAESGFPEDVVQEWMNERGVGFDPDALVKHVDSQGSTEHHKRGHKYPPSEFQPDDDEYQDAKRRQHEWQRDESWWSGEGSSKKLRTAARRVGASVPREFRDQFNEDVSFAMEAGHPAEVGEVLDRWSKDPNGGRLQKHRDSQGSTAHHKRGRGDERDYERHRGRSTGKEQPWTTFETIKNDVDSSLDEVADEAFDQWGDFSENEQADVIDAIVNGFWEAEAATGSLSSDVPLPDALGERGYARLERYVDQQAKRLVNQEMRGLRGKERYGEHGPGRHVHEEGDDHFSRSHDTLRLAVSTATATVKSEVELHGDHDQSSHGRRRAGAPSTQGMHPHRYQDVPGFNAKERSTDELGLILEHGGGEETVFATFQELERRARAGDSEAKDILIDWDEWDDGSDKLEQHKDKHGSTDHHQGGGRPSARTSDEMPERFYEMGEALGGLTELYDDADLDDPGDLIDNELGLFIEQNSLGRVTARELATKFKERLRSDDVDVDHPEVRRAIHDAVRDRFKPGHGNDYDVPDKGPRGPGGTYQEHGRTYGGGFDVTPRESDVDTARETADDRRRRVNHERI